jgi:hypothetical protein
MRDIKKKVKINFLLLLNFAEWTKYRLVTKLSILFGPNLRKSRLSLDDICVLIHGENKSKSKFEIIEKYSELEHYSYSDFESKDPIGHTFQQSYHLKISDVILDTRTGILFTLDRKLISESSSWSPEFLAATNYIKPPRINQVLRLDEERPLISLSSNSYYHWLNEDLPHYLYLLDKLQNPITLVSMKRPSFVSDFLVSNSINYLEVPRYAKCSEFDFISNKSNVGWPHPKDLSILHNHFNVHFSEVILGKKIYISRIGDSRSPLFENELIQLLETSGWKVINAAKLTLAEQINEISSAEVLAGIHGAGLSGVNWMNQGTKIIEIGTDKFVRCFQRLSILNEVEYFRINYKNDSLGLSIITRELENLGVL